MALKDLSITERKIVGAFLDDVMALSRATNIEVEILGDGQRDYLGTFERSIVDSHIGNCSETTVCVRHGNARGNVLFVHGLDDEVVANIGGNTEGYDMMNALLARAEAIASEVV